MEEGYTLQKMKETSSSGKFKTISHNGIVFLVYFLFPIT